MATPDLRAQIVRGNMQDVSIKFSNDEYIGDRVALIKDGVSHKSKITKYSPGYWFRDEAKVRAPGTRAARGAFDIEYVDVTTKQYAFAKEVTREDIEAESDVNTPPLNMVQDAIEYAADKVDLKKEKRIASLIHTTAWAGDAAGGEDAGGLWAPGASNTFLADIRAGKGEVRDLTGKVPNTLILDWQTMEQLKEEATIADKIKYTMKDVLTPALLASLLGLQEIIVGSAIENTAKEATTDAFTGKNVWEVTAGKGAAFLFYRPARMGLKVAAALGQFRIRQTMGGGGGRLTRSWYEQAEDQWVYETREDTDIVALHTGLGKAWQNTHSA